MTARRLTRFEAEELIEVAFAVPPDVNARLVEATLAGTGMEAARITLDRMLGMMPAQIDPDSIEITHDVLDHAPDMDACRIVIKTEEWI